MPQANLTRKEYTHTGRKTQIPNIPSEPIFRKAYSMSLCAT